MHVSLSNSKFKIKQLFLIIKKIKQLFKDNFKSSPFSQSLIIMKKKSSTIYCWSFGNYGSLVMHSGNDLKNYEYILVTVPKK